ncbi:MAG TPA: DUF87 domain-containing protein, partial [Ktedonobacteraceae bacterium]
FFAMAGAGVLFGLGFIAFLMIKRRVARMQLSGRDVTHILFGVAPSPVVDEQGVQVTEDLPAQATTLLLPTPQEVSEMLPDTIIEENPLALADNFQPSVHTYLGQVVAVVGVRRSGKSHFIAVSIEELARYALPLVIFDTEDEYGSLVDPRFMPRCVHVGSEEGLAESTSVAQYRVLDMEGAYAFGKSILEGRLQVVVNLRSWQDEDAAIIMSEIVDGMNAWQQAKKNEERIPVMVVLDEAQKWLPQNTGDKYVTSETQTLLHHAFNDTIVARGGKRGFGLILGFQRYSQINKNALQSTWKFLFRQTETIDLKKYEALGIEVEDTVSLLQGQCFVFSPTVLGFKARIRTRYSKHNADTPGLNNLLRQKHDAPVDLYLPTKYTAYAPQERMADLPMKGTVSPLVKEKELLDRAMNAYQEGATSIDKLAAKLEITSHAARMLKPKVEAALREMESDKEVAVE